jgi:hypothetical protein
MRFSQPSGLLEVGQLEGPGPLARHLVDGDWGDGDGQALGAMGDVVKGGTTVADKGDNCRGTDRGSPQGQDSAAGPLQNDGVNVCMARVASLLSVPATV